MPSAACDLKFQAVSSDMATLFVETNQQEFLVFSSVYQLMTFLV